MKLVTGDRQTVPTRRHHDRAEAVGIAGMSVPEVRWFEPRSGHTEIYAGSGYRIDSVPKIRIDMVARWDPLRQARPRV